MRRLVAKILISFVLIAIGALWFVYPQADPEKEKFYEFSKVDLCRDIKLGGSLKYAEEYFSKSGFTFKVQKFPQDKYTVHIVFFGKKGMVQSGIIYDLRFNYKETLLKCSKRIIYTFL